MAATTRCLGSMDRSNRSENHVIFWLHPFHLYCPPLVHDTPLPLSRDFFSHHRPINSVILLIYVVTDGVKKKRGKKNAGVSVAHNTGHPQMQGICSSGWRAPPPLWSLLFGCRAWSVFFPPFFFFFFFFEKDFFHPDCTCFLTQYLVSFTMRVVSKWRPVLDLITVVTMKSGDWSLKLHRAVDSRGIVFNKPSIWAIVGGMIVIAS